MKKNYSSFLVWLNSTILSKSEHNNLKRMNKSIIESCFLPSGLNFGTGGVRAKMNLGTSVLNKYTYVQLAYAFAKYLKNKYRFKNIKVVIGHDNRLNSDTFALIVAEVLTSFDIKIMLFPNNELVPTPLVSFTIRNNNATAGIVITASHNPKEYNGFKIYDENGCQATEEITSKVSSFINRKINILDIKYNPKRQLISYLTKDIYDKYFKSSTSAILNKKIIKINKKQTIVFTGHHGTTSRLMPYFLNKCLNFNVLPVKEQCYYDTNFSNSPFPNPEDYKSFDKAIRYADKISSNICIGTDPDGDRIGVCIKHNGVWVTINGNQMGCILAHYILRNKKILPNSYIVTTFVSTNEIKDICNDYGVNLYITKIGFKWIGKLVDKLGPKHHYLLGFEESVGALPYTNTRDKDAFTSAALILEVDYFCKTHGMDLIDYLYKNIYEKYGYCYTLTDTITINDIHWRSKVLKIINKLQHMNIKEIGGYSIISKKFHKKYNVLEWKLNNNSWIKFRMSGTEPKIKTYLNLYCDKNDRGIGNKVIDSIKLLIK